jgi:CarD family transcriptional regulator
MKEKKISDDPFEFSVGETVVEPSIGICEIKGKTRLQIDDKIEDFFIFHSGTAKVMIPKSQLKKRGIRKPISPKEVKKIYKLLSDYKEVSRDVSRQQYINDMNILKRGNIIEIATLLKSLYTVELVTELKGKEKEIFNNAKRVVMDELMYVTKKSKAIVNNEIDKALAEISKKRLKAKTRSNP